MSALENGRGAAQVGLLAEAGPVEAVAIAMLRLWFDGPAGQAEVWNGLASALGQEQGRKALSAFESLLRICLRHGRRPLMRHAPACPCIGADEACFAALVADAAEGAREDAMLISTLIVRPEFAPAAAACAEELGVALRRATLTRGASVIRRSHVAAKLH